MATYRQQFQELQKYSHTSYSTADLWFGGAPIATNLPITSGNVGIDAASSTKRTVRLTLVDKTGKLTPKVPTDRLAPFGSEIRVKRGYIYNGGKSQFVWGIGYFRISSADAVDEGSGATIAITGYDRSRALSLSRVELPYVVAAGTTVLDAIAEIVARQQGQDGIGVSVQTSSNGTIGALRVIDAESDPWQAIQSLATDIGCEVFFDTSGTLVVRDIPDPLSAPLQDTYEYGALSRFTKMNKTLTDDPGYNGVVVIAEPMDAVPLAAEYFDEDPMSPTNSLGPYGRRPMFYRSQYVTTQDQADKTAQALYWANVGITEQVKFEAVPNPFLDAGDVIAIRYSDLGLNDRYVVESVDMPLGPADLMTVTCRKRKFG